MPPLPSYAELHCVSHFTFLQGASSPEELVARACELGYEALAITDECSLSGVVRAHVAARSTRLKLLIGSRFVLQDGLAFLLVARSRRGYGQLSHLITQGRRAARKGQYLIDRSLVEQQCLDECLGLWLPPEQEAPEEPLQWLQQQLPGRVWIAVELLLRGDDRR
ncbi:MAG: PHP domain-containing protein, partial [Pseudomonadales bacterium]|nr:PHP domain-containing protein [Pseudomonadales bacterium]